MTGHRYTSPGIDYTMGIELVHAAARGCLYPPARAEVLALSGEQTVLLALNLLRQMLEEATDDQADDVNWLLAGAFLTPEST